MTDQFERWRPVVDEVNARIDDLGMSQAEVARRAGLSDATVRSFMTGKFRGEPRPPIRAKLCRALDWSIDSIDLILAGRSPVLAAGPSTHDEVSQLQDDVGHVRDQVALLAQLLREQLGLDLAEIDRPIDDDGEAGPLVL